MEDPMQAARENVKRINVKTEIILRIDCNSRDRYGGFFQAEPLYRPHSGSFFGIGTQIAGVRDGWQGEFCSVWQL